MISYSSSNTAVATVSGSTVAIVGAGTSVITASQVGNTNYNAATNVTQTLTVNKANQTITFNPLSTSTYGDLPFSLTASTSSGLSITYTSSNTSVATVSGSTVTIVGSGITTIMASQSGNGNYNVATSVPQTLTVNKANQTITFNALATVTYGDAPFNLTALASSGLLVTYASSNTAVAIVSGNTVTIVGAGTTTITASQSGNGNYNAATNVLQTLTVNKASQTITFNALAAKTYGDVPFSLTATASSGLVVTYVSSNTAVATVSGNTITIVGAGSATITASQGGNTNYNPAADATQPLIVNKASQTITFAALPTKNVGDAPFTLTATASSGLAVSYTSSDATVASVSNGVVTIVGAGIAVITASQPGDVNYNPATNVQQTLTVLLPKPTVPSSYVFLIHEYATQIDLVTLVGNGNGRLVVVKKDGPIDFVPVDNMSYTVGQTVGSNNDNIIGLVLSGSANSGTIKNLQPGGTYYFDIYEFNKSNNYYSYLTTATATGGQITMPLQTVQVITPINNSINQNAPTMNVTVSAVTGATTYTIELYTNSFYSGTPIVKSGTAVTQSFTGLAYSTQYFARAKTDLSPIYGPGTTFTTEPPEADAFVSTPANGSTGTLVSLNVTSNAVSGATTYYIDLSTTPDFSGNVISKSGASATQAFSGLAFSTLYYARVKTNLSSTYGAVKSFTTADPLTLSYVISPANAATAQATSLNVTSNTLTGATTYNIQLSPDQTFATGLISKTSSTPTANFTGLYYNTKYYSRVTSDLTPGQWGAVKNFTTRDHVLSSGPANNSTNANYYLTLTATAISGATAYTIEANTASDFTGASIVKTGAAAQIFNLAYNTQYYIRVTCNLASGWGSTLTFTTGDPLSLAYVVTPANAATAQATSLAVVANTLNGATSYTIQLSPDQTFATGVVQITSSTPTANFSGLYYNTTYYSRVSSNLMPGQWGSLRSFTTRDHVLTTAPANNATNVNYYLTLTAATITGATIYTIEANTASNFTGTSIVRTGAASQIFTLAYNTQYYVRATCNLASGWGSTLTFTTGDPVSLAFVTNPVNGGTSNYTSQNVTANLLNGATSYTIELNTNSDFTGTSIVQTGSSNVLTFTGLTPGTTYYTRVQTNLSPSWGTTVTNFTTVLTGGRVVADVPVTAPVELGPFDVTVLGNPFQDRLSLLITSPDQIDADIQIVDQMGRNIFRATHQTNAQLEIENQWAQGIYILHVKAGAKTKAVRVMRE